MHNYIMFICLLAITGCSTVNIDCFRDENKDTPYCVERKQQRMERPIGGKLK